MTEMPTDFDGIVDLVVMDELGKHLMPYFPGFHKRRDALQGHGVDTTYRELIGNIWRAEINHTQALVLPASIEAEVARGVAQACSEEKAKMTPRQFINRIDTCIKEATGSLRGMFLLMLSRYNETNYFDQHDEWEELHDYIAPFVVETWILMEQRGHDWRDIS